MVWPKFWPNCPWRKCLWPNYPSTHSQNHSHSTVTGIWFTGLSVFNHPNWPIKCKDGLLITPVVSCILGLFL